MKLSFRHIKDRITEEVTIDEISEKLFQLGHENTIENEIIDIEITPNRGDCLSLLGILRELSVFYDVDKEFDLYSGDIEKFGPTVIAKLPLIMPKVNKFWDNEHCVK